MTTLLLDGDTEGSYSTVNVQRGGSDSSTGTHAWAMIMALSVHAGASGWTRDQLSHVLLETGAQAGRHARHIKDRRGHDRAIEWLNRIWDRAEDYRSTSTAIHTRQDAHARVAELRVLVETLPWRGRAATTDLRNLSVRLDLCRAAGGPRHDVSLMQLAERVGCSRSTAQCSNDRLKTLGWLRVLRETNGTVPCLWELIEGKRIHGSAAKHRQLKTTAPATPVVNTTRPRPITPQDRQTGADLSTRTVSRLTAEDAFAARGLGGGTLKVACALVENSGQTTRDLMASASCSQPTVSRATRRLAELGLATRTGETWSLTEKALDGIGTSEGEEPAVNPATGWDDIAERVGTAGTAERRRERHAALRRAWDEERQRQAEHRRPDIKGTDPRAAGERFVNTSEGVLDRLTGEVDPHWKVANDGQWIRP